jgi:hypothetical protein
VEQLLRSLLEQEPNLFIAHISKFRELSHVVTLQPKNKFW